MADKSNTTNATELLNKICSGGTITPQDLGTPTANTQATILYVLRHSLYIQ